MSGKNKGQMQTNSLHRANIIVCEIAWKTLCKWKLRVNECKRLLERAGEEPKLCALWKEVKLRVKNKNKKNIYLPMKFRSIVQFVCVNVSQCNTMKLKLHMYSNLTLFSGDSFQTQNKWYPNPRNTRSRGKKVRKLWQKNYTRFPLLHITAVKFIWSVENLPHMCSVFHLKKKRPWVQLSMTLKRH